MPTPHALASDTAPSASGPPDGVPLLGGPGKQLRLIDILYAPGPRPRTPAFPLSQSNFAPYLPPRPTPLAAGIPRHAPTPRRTRDQTEPYFKRPVLLRLPHERVWQGSPHRNRAPGHPHSNSASHVRFHESENAQSDSSLESCSSLSSDEESGSSNSSHSSSRSRASTGKRRGVGRPVSAPIPSSTPPATPARVAGSAATQPTAGPSSVLHPTGPPPGLPTPHGAAMAKPHKPELRTKEHLRWNEKEWKRVKDVADNVLMTLTDIALSASNQPKGKLEECYAEMIRREPHLASNYEGAWPVPTIVASRLKYWARQKKIEAAMATDAQPPKEKDTGKRKRKRNEGAAAEPGSSQQTRSRRTNAHPVDVIYAS